LVQRPARLVVAAVGVTFVMTGCTLGGDDRSATEEIQDSLKFANVAHVTVEACEFQEDPEESEFSMYRCNVVAGPEGAVLPGDHDRLSPGRSMYCFDVPRLPHGGGTDPIDADAYPAWSARAGRCF
jgi:hypothetical protein